MNLDLRFLERMKINKKGDFLYAKAKFGPSKQVKIPIKLNQDLACFVGIIIGDGNLKKTKQRLTIELVDKRLIKKIQNLTYLLFEKKVIIHKRIDKRPKRKIRYYLNINSAAIYDLMNQTFNIPKGKKSDKVTTPLLILKANESIKRAFLIGIMVTDGGKRRWRHIGLSSASEKLRNSISDILNDLKINHKLDKWIHKKYKKTYFGLYFTRDNIKHIMRGCRSGQTGQILESFLEKI